MVYFDFQYAIFYQNKEAWEKIKIIKIFKNLPMCSYSVDQNGTFCGKQNTASFVESCNVSTVNRMLNHLFGTGLQQTTSQQ